MDSQCVNLNLRFFNDSPQFAFGKAAVIVLSIRDHKQHPAIIPCLSHRANCNSHGIE